MNNRSDTGGARASRAVFMLARLLVGVVGLLLLVFGSSFCWGFFAEGAEWWILLFGLFQVFGGLWFGWSAVHPHRENVKNMSTEFVARVLVELF